MENYQKDFKEMTPQENSGGRKTRIESHSGRILAGLIVVIVGTLLLAREAGAYVPWWLFSWQMLLIGIGLFVGARRSFRGFGWMIPMAIGGVFLLEEFVPDLSFRHYLWPMVIIFVGLVMIFRPRHHRRRKWDRWSEATVSDDTVDSVSVFGGAKKIIISKDFKGGELTTVFGGTELNLMQADFQGTISLDVTQVFGGTKLIVPAHWNIKSDVVCAFGATEDKRPQMREPADNTKVLKLEGTCLFGAIEIKSY